MTARTDTVDVIAGLKAATDDYVTNPLGGRTTARPLGPDRPLSS
ncbi:hypothetical protein [Kutzneria kofuensis]